MPIETLQLEDKKITIVGTAHVSKASVEEVRSTLRAEAPDAVAVELCRSRFEIFKNPQAWQNMDIFKVVKEKKTAFLLGNLLLASFQKRIGEKLGVKPGDEMRVAIEEAEAMGSTVVLMDRPIQITLARAWRGLRFMEKMKLLYGGLLSLFAVEDIESEDVEKYKEMDMLTSAVEEMAKYAPTIKKVLIDERDAYMAKKLADIPGKKIVGVVGAGHMQGIAAQINRPLGDLAALEEIPPKKQGVMKWIIGIGILALLGMGFHFGGVKHGYDMLKLWAACTMTCTAVATILTLAHPITVLVAAVAAPITTVIRVVHSGWAAGLTEAYLKKPKVSDFETLPDDILKLGGWWKNPITRILLVVCFANSGSLVGMLIAAPMMARVAMQ